MASNVLSRPAPFGAITIYRIVRNFDEVLSAIVAWNKARQSRAVLSRLSDDQLRDIGLERGSIDTF